MNDWINQPTDTTEWLGFVYLVTSPDGMKYVGKKMFWSSIRRKPLKGTKRVRLDRRESDWKKYYGSSKDLQSDLERLGKDGWKREMIHWCKSKWDLSYLELIEQLDRDVLRRSDYYNGIIHVRLSVRKKRDCQEA